MPSKALKLWTGRSKRCRAQGDARRSLNLHAINMNPHLANRADPRSNSPARIAPAIFSLMPLIGAVAFAQSPEPITPEQLKEEAIIFTPPGFTKVGEPKWAGTVKGVIDGRAGQIDIVVRPTRR